MGDCSCNIELNKYDKKSWLKSALLGFLIGIGVVVPGISGSTIAIIFGLYAQILFAMGNVFKSFKKCFTFLLPIILGMLVGILVGFIAVKSILDLLPFAIICLFAGLMCGAFPAVTNEIKDVKLNAKLFILMVLGAIVPVALGVVSVVFASSDSAFNLSNAFASCSWWFVALCVVIGYLVGVTQIVPGLSATALLMMFGIFKVLVDSISFSYWQVSPQVFLIYVALGIGFLLGITTFSKLLTCAFNRAKCTVFTFIVGLSLGSIISMFFNPDSFEVYQNWNLNGIVVLDLVLAIVLFIGGFIVSYMLVLKEIKK